MVMAIAIGPEFVEKLRRISFGFDFGPRLFMGRLTKIKKVELKSDGRKFQHHNQFIESHVRSPKRESCRPGK